MGTKNLYRRLETAKAQAQPAPRVRRVAQRDTARDEMLFDDAGDFNPRSIGQLGRQGVTDAKPGQGERIYDNKGEINAGSKREAVEKAAYVTANILARGDADAKFDRTASRQEVGRRNAMVRQAMESDEGRHLIAQEMKLPLKDQVDYMGWTTQILRLRTVGPGEFYRVPRDVRATATVIGQDGQAVESRIHGRWVQPPKYPITSMATIPLEDLSEITYDVLERIKATMEQEMKRERDKRTVDLLDAAAVRENATTGFASVGPAVLEALRYQVERHGLFVDKFLVNRQEVRDVNTSMAAQLDPVSQRELNLQGVWSQFLGAKIVTTSGVGIDQTVRAGRMYAVTASEYLGEFISWIDMMVEPINKLPQGELVKGFIAYELVGSVIPNQRSCSLAVRS